MISISGGNGTTKEEAIIISAPRESIGIAAEYDYLSEIYGEPERDWHLIKQNLVYDDKAGKSYDLLTIQGKGTEYEVWFDVTDFYGKFY